MPVCTCPVSDERFDVPLWIQLRSNPVVKAETSLKIGDGKTVLSEIPRRLEGISVTVDGSVLTEIRDQYQELGDGEYRVNYSVGWLFFNADFYPDGSIINSVEYTARGVVLYPLERVIRADGTILTDGINSVYDDGVLISDTIGKFDFRQNIEVEVDPLDSTKVIINVDPNAGFGGALIDLSDAPSTYVSQAGKILAVNAGETAVEFIDIADVVIDPKDSLQTYDSSINSVFGVVEPIDGSPEFNKGYGLSLNQQSLYGDMRSGALTYWLAGNSADLTLVSDKLKVAEGGTNYPFAYQEFDVISGNDYFIGYSGYYGNANFTIKITDTSNVLIETIVSNSAVDIVKGSHIFTPTTTETIRVELLVETTVLAQYSEFGDIQFIDITNTPLNAHTATQINAIVQEYIEGYTYITNLELQSNGVNLMELGSGSEEIAGMTFTRVSNGILINGTASAVARINLLDVISFQTSGSNIIALGHTIPTKNGETYAFQSNVISGSFVGTGNFTVLDKDGAVVYNADIDTSGTGIALKEMSAVYIFPSSGDVFTDCLINFQINEGTTASTYQAHNSPEDNFKLIANLLSVGTSVRDEVYPLNGAWWKDKYVNLTPYVLTADDITAFDNTTFTNDFATITNGILSGVKTFTDGIDGYIDILGHSEMRNTGDDYNDTSLAGAFATLSNGKISMTSLAGTWADLAAAKVALTGKVIYYALETVVTEEIEKNGSLIQEANTTIIQLNNFATEYDITFATNQVAQIGINKDNIVYIFGEIDNLENDLAALDVRVVSIEGKTDFITVTQVVDLDTMETDISDNKTNIGIILNLDTTSTNLVDAVNEVRGDLIIAESDISNNADQITLNVAAIGLNTTHRSSDGKNHSDVVLNNTHRGSDGKNHSDVVLNNAKVTYPSADSTKVGHITVSADINLNKVAEYTEVMGSVVDVSNATTIPAANVTTTSTNGYDALDIELKFGDTTKTLRMGIGVNGAEQILSFVYSLSTTTDVRAIFKLHRTSDTSYTAYYGRSVSNTGSGSVHVATANIDILKIYGVKFT